MQKRRFWHAEKEYYVDSQTTTMLKGASAMTCCDTVNASMNGPGRASVDKPGSMIYLDNSIIFGGL